MTKRLLRTVTHVGYVNVAKPILFRFSPDKVHHSILRAGRIVQNAPLLKSAPRLWSYRSKKLQQTLAGVVFDNSIGLAAGFDKNIEVLPLLESVGFGFMTGGSVTARACEGNPRPWFYRLPAEKSLVVHAGLPNEGVEQIAARIESYSPRLLKQFPLIVSVAKTNDETSAKESEAIDDYCTSLTRLEKVHGIAMYEINISCPNTFGGEPFTTPERLERLLDRIDALSASRPIVIKMPISLEWLATRSLLQVIAQHNVQGVTIGNLQKDRSSLSAESDLSDTVPGGLSGLPTQQRSTEYIARTYKEFGDKLFIIGVGGVFTAEDAYEKIRAGASLVGLITGMIFEGPQVVGTINNSLVELLHRDGYRHVRNAIGADVAR